MAQHFSQSKNYRDLGLLTVAALSNKEAHDVLCCARWGSTETIGCPYCGVIAKHYARPRRLQWCCRECDRTFSVTTGTPLADRKLSYNKILTLIFLFVAAPKSEAANKMHATMQVTRRTVYVLFGKLREALWFQRDLAPLWGEVQIDGGHFCGKPRRANVRKGITSLAVNSRLRNRKAGIAPLQKGEKMESWNVKKLKNRRIALVMRQIAGERGAGAFRTKVVIVPAETAKHVIAPILANVVPGSLIMTDDSHAYKQLAARYEHKSVKHSERYSTPEGVNQNQAEAFFSRLRRAEYGTYHGMRKEYFALYAYEMAWREDVRKMTMKEKFMQLLTIFMRSGMSCVWRGYNQGHRLPAELTGLPGEFVARA